MGEVIKFIPKAERERGRLIREARAIYDSIFPPADPVAEPQGKTQQSKTSVGQATLGANAYRGDGVLRS